MWTCCLSLLFGGLAVGALGQGQPDPAVNIPFRTTPEDLVVDEITVVPEDSTAPQVQPASGPIGPAATQPQGVLSGRIVFMSGGHGWIYGSAWNLERPVLLEMNEDYGNVDQMTLFAYYCFNAGATVVPMRPIGNQTNEVVIDNVSPSVAWSGAWTDSASAVYYGAPGQVAYRFTTAAATETATATYTPAIPAAGFYPVYAWALSSGNRTNQLYRINHTGGQALVRVPHHMVGNGWVYLGTYYFNAGANAARGSVVISNLGEGPNVIPAAIIADAIRFGNGMGDVDDGGGISRYPREEEGSRYWIQRSLGQGQDSRIYSNGNVTAPPRMAAEMNRSASGNIFKRIYFGFHSNASSGSARGVVALYNDPANYPNQSANSDTPNQKQFATIIGTEVNADMVSLGAPPLEVSWGSRSAITYVNPNFAYGEINNNHIEDEFDATIVEVAFHDNANDALLLRDPKARNWLARATLHGYIRYLNQFDGAPLNFPPEPPYNVRTIGSAGGVTVAWSTPIAQGGSGTPTSYRVYRSTDGYGFGNPVTVAYIAGSTVQSAAVTGLEPSTDYYFRVSAVNAGGESMPSETVGCRFTTNSLSSRILFVNGFTRFDRTLNLRQTPARRNYKAPGHDLNTGTIDRVMPRAANSFDYVVQHGKAIAASSLMPFDSCQVQAVTNGQVSLPSYKVVVWACGNQTVAQRTLNAAAQSRLSSFLTGGGHLLISGSDIAWDLDRASGPSASDRNFLRTRLRVALQTDANNNAGVYNFTPVAGGLFAGNPSGVFDDGSKGIYFVGSPDAVLPFGPGAASALNYVGCAGGAAGVVYDGSAGGGRVVFLGFPFETITSASVRQALMADVLKSFSRPPRFDFVTALPNGATQIGLSGEPGVTYAIQASADYSNWITIAHVMSPTGTIEFTDPSTAYPQRFYRAVTAF